jgi:hypothetical protein
MLFEYYFYYLCKAKFFQAFIDCQLYCSLKRHLVLLVLVVNQSFIYIVQFCLVLSAQYHIGENKSAQLKNSKQFKIIQNN